MIDPAFGAIEYVRDVSWGGDHLPVPWPSPYPVSVVAAGTSVGPSDDARRKLAEVLARMPELNAQVASVLVEDYLLLRTTNQSVEDQTIHEANEIWKHANLAGIWLALPPGERHADFELDYSMDWDNDHRFVAFFDDWKLVNIRKDG